MEEKKEITENIEAQREQDTQAQIASVEESEMLAQESSTGQEKMKKHDEAILLVNEAKTIVSNADQQTEECKLLLSDDLKSYNEAKEALLSGGLEASDALLLKLGYRENFEDEDELNSVVFEAKEELAPMYVSDISSGKFTGFILSLISGAGTLAGLVYLATQKLGITLDISKIPSEETIQTILAWFGTLVGMNGNINAGGATIAAAVVIVMGLIYTIRISRKGSENLDFAARQLEEAEEYALHKGNCKTEMDRVDAHINESIETLNTYRVLLNEQKGKLQRILHIEGEKEEGTAYHKKSVEELKDTQSLIVSIKQFMAVPMSEQGRLSEESRRFLRSAKNKMEKVLERLY